MNAAPTVSQEDFRGVQEKITPYLEAAERHGVALREITGSALDLGDRLGIDINAVGEQGLSPDLDEMPAEDYYRQFMRAVWVLSDDLDRLVDAADADEGTIAKAHLRWRTKTLTSIEIEKVLMQAFVARWMEHRVAMVAAFDDGEG